MQAWLFLVTAILLDVLGTLCLKLADGFGRPLYSAAVLFCYGASLVLFSYALKGLPVSLVYAVGSGIGTALVALLGCLLFHEPFDGLKVFSLALIVAGIVGLYWPQPLPH